MPRFLFMMVALGLSWPAVAFEVKGYTPGMEIGKVNLTACEKVNNADSGFPGFRCDTTLGGDKAELWLAVFEERVIGANFVVRDGRMTPTLDALTEKYGRPNKSNRYIEDYDWRKGDLILSIKDRPDRGYRVLVVDLSLFNKANAAAASKAKKDI